MGQLRAFSYGGGVQSTAALVLAAQGKIDFPTFLFSNVGEDSEHPATLEYVHNVAMPYAKEHGIDLVELHRKFRNGETETLMGRLTKEGSRSLPIPIRMPNGKPGNRACTKDFKIRVIAKWLKANGASEESPATVGIGISWDELERINNRRLEPYEDLVYPLVDLRISRDNCIGIISGAGLPVPGKSACFFCPFHRLNAWRDQKRDEPELFEKSVELERVLNERREMLGKYPVYLTRYNKPLDQAVGEGVQEAFDFSGPDTCDTGHCFV